MLASTFFAYLLTSLIPALTTTSFDLTGKRRRGEFADTFPIAAMVSTLSRHLRWNLFVKMQQMLNDSSTTAEYRKKLPRKAMLCARTLAQRKLSVENRIGTGHFDPTSNKIKVMTMKVNKVLEFPVVALPGVGRMPAAWEDKKEAARVFYVAARRATQRLVMGVGGDGEFGVRLQQ